MSPRQLICWLAGLSTLVVASAAGGRPAGRGSVGGPSARRELGQLVRPVDPVLAALSEGRLIREVAAPVAGAVRLPAVRYGFALTGEPLGKLDITGTPEAGLEVDRFVAHFANWWKGRVRRKEREVGAQTLTRLDNGAVPILLVSFDYYANPGDAACSWPCWW